MAETRRFSVLAVSGNRDYLLMIKKYVERTDLFSSCRFAFHGKEAIEKFAEAQPDLLIMDVILTQIDGISVLETLNRQQQNMKRTKVIMTSATDSDFLVNKSFECGADYFLVKPFHYYTFHGRVMDLLVNCEKQDSCFSGLEEFVHEGRQDGDMQIITRIIQRLGLRPNSKGYKYVRYAIYLVLQDDSILSSITQKLYPAVAAKFESNAKCVERDIRHSIETAWMKGDLRYIDELFGYTVDANKGKPTNSAFIAIVADYIQLNRQKVD